VDPAQVADLRADGVSPGDGDVALADIPLVVDVDGTLLRSDLLLESTICLLNTRPLDALRIPVWLCGGKALLKSEIADRVTIDADLLPLDPTVVAFMQGEKERGRRIFLASASERRFVEAIAARLGFIDGVFATDRTTNLSGVRKRDVLVRAFGERRFDYIGNSRADWPIWDVARRGYVVSDSVFGLSPFSFGKARQIEVLVKRPLRLRDVGKALRLHQWAKNLLLFVPLVLGGAGGNPDTVVKTLVCFVAFGLLASSTYLVNDMFDLTSDRRHPQKRHRPLASGVLPITAASGLVLLGLAAGLGIGALLGFPVFLALVGYLAATLAYSLVLKSKPIVDVVLLAGLYTWRLLVGVLVADVVLSPWLIVFSFAFFLSLSLTKRNAEINGMLERGITVLPGRGYQSCDGPFVLSMGVAAGVSSILIFVLYLIEGAFHAAHFSRPEILWTCPVILLMWLCRIWLLSARGLLHEDPVIFAVVDRKSLILGAVAALAVLAAIVA
jgi:4-hydroxybenzoate polyprenyltransferase